jgi:hypothetical protein
MLTEAEIASNPALGENGVHDFAYGVEYDSTQDVLTLWTGPTSDLSIRPGRRLAEILAAGFAAVEEQERREELPDDAHTCPYCTEPIRWVRLAPKDQWHPVDAAPHKHGTIQISPDGLNAHLLRRYSDVTGPLYRSHVETCKEMAKGYNRYQGPENESEDTP